MFIDLVCGALLFFAAWRGWRAGFFSAVFSFAGIFIGFFLAMKCSAFVANYLKENNITEARWATLFAFVLIVLVVWLLLQLLAKALSIAANAIMMGWLNKSAGGLIFVFIYILMISGVFLFLDQLSVFSKETIDASFLYPVIRPVAPALLTNAGEWIPWFKETFSDLNRSF